MTTIVCAVDGGLGKNIMFTGVIKALRKKYLKERFVIVTGYPDVFVNNENVDVVLHSSQTVGIYDKYLTDPNSKVFVSDPYHTSDFIMNSKHLIQIWCELYGVEYNGELPEIFLTKAEHRYFEPFYNTDKPIFAIQPNGGAESQPIKYSWTRDLPAPIVDEIIDFYKKDYTILHIKRKDQLSYKNTVQALDSWRSIAIMLLLSKKRLLIDSSSLHIATALNLPSVVTWITTKPNIFGYDMHQNIIAKEPTKKINVQHNYYQKNLLFEDVSTFPYEDLKEMFDVNEIIKALK